MTPPRREPGLVVNKSVSLPISLVNAVMDEADLMHESFSGALVKLTRLGLVIRKDERQRLERHQKEEDAAALARIRAAVPSDKEG